MTVSGWLQIAFYSVALLLITKPLGIYVLKVYDGSLTWLRPVERALYRLAGVDPAEDQHGATAPPARARRQPAALSSDPSPRKGTTAGRPSSALPSPSITWPPS